MKKQHKKFVLILGGILVLLVVVSTNRARKWEARPEPTTKAVTEVTATIEKEINYAPTEVGTGSTNIPDELQPDEATCGTCGKAEPSQVRCSVHADVFEGAAPLSVVLTYFAYDYDPNVSVTGIQWDFDGNNTWDTSMGYDNAEVTHVFKAVGVYNVRMKVGFSDGSETPVCTTEIRVN